jgi:hypothetical protein
MIEDFLAGVVIPDSLSASQLPVLWAGPRNCGPLGLTTNRTFLNNLNLIGTSGREEPIDQNAGLSGRHQSTDIEGRGNKKPACKASELSAVSTLSRHPVRRRRARRGAV